ncbi:Uncharacterised protein [Bacteroides xylanisolvens]|nr:Uncharacterised protein [Bacteroides xylanisolvens]
MPQRQEKKPENRWIQEAVEKHHQHHRCQHEEPAHGRSAALGPMRLRSFGADRLARLQFFQKRNAHPSTDDGEDRCF